jgi:hypothetical protein
LNKKRFKIILVFIIAFTTLSWGFYGHKKINKHAVLILPSPLINIYKKNIIFITEHSVDADKKRYSIETEKYNHYIDIDSYNLPIDSIPRNWQKANELFNKDSILKHGILPWNILFVKYLLQKAFEENNLEKILRLSADLGHYIGDLHVPLHTTKNYNGQFSNQHGIHSLWESRMVELYSNEWNLFTGKATYIEKPTAIIWERLKESNKLTKQVFEYETEASNITINKFAYETVNQQVKKVYSKEFCENYKKMIEKMIENRLKLAITLTGSIWYTCWVDAGQPEIKQRKVKNKEKSVAIEDECNH